MGDREDKSKGQRRQAASRKLPTKALRDLIQSRNEEVFNNLQAQLRSPLGVIPFVGAGMSAAVPLIGNPPSFPQWHALLRKLASDRAIEIEVKGLLDQGEYEKAASRVEADRPGVLTGRIKDAFDRVAPREKLLQGAISYLPYLASGPVITTNFDHVLEQVFEAAGRPFGNVISGPQPDATIAAIHRNQHALLKIHGDCRDRTFRVFTADEYERAYGVQPEGVGAPARIGSLAWLLFTNRPLLFLGCSLEQDRTVHVLRAIRELLPGLTHYAVLAAAPSLDLWEERERQLDGIGVRALWYAPERFDEIEVLLQEALERASGRLCEPARDPAPPPVVVGSERKTMAEIPALLRSDLLEIEPSRHPLDLRLIGRTLLQGRLAFFLGAYANLNSSLLGNRFYERLALQFKCPILAGDRTAVAAYIISHHGSQRLWDEVRSVLQSDLSGPSVVHRLIAALPEFMRKREVTAPLWILTTNYDVLMERAMEEAGEPFRLLYYANGDPDDGFVERSPDGVLRWIEMPDNFRHVDHASHIIVKLNGGISDRGDIKEHVAIERSHFERLAARIPGVLPAFVRAELRARSLLFLGHGLAEPDVKALIQYAHAGDAAPRSWAVQLAPETPAWRQSWEAQATLLQRWGVKVLDDDLERFVAALHQHLQRLSL